MKKRATTAQMKPVVMPLYICGFCGKDTREGGVYHIQKIQAFGYANMLCEVCQQYLKLEMADIAKKYLNKLA
jgi:hypothetical protein